MLEHLTSLQKAPSDFCEVKNQKAPHRSAILSSTFLKLFYSQTKKEPGKVFRHAHMDVPEYTGQIQLLH
jgi:hypothetical protein